ncbi:LysR family transcriptional regulator [Demequina sediminicola]|uniref:LysR family transcriptional regulator n=1 Tax=Demequina sediminicola TaxID=1095026 RepID=UPI0007840FCA|nr:LysR family transcriptional regulator [Demequina sediminicola]
MPEPSIEELRMLLAVKSRGSLTAAAEDLGVSQQAVSQRMRTLERKLGLSLFARTARGTTLTSNGLLVADWAATVAGRMDALVTAAEALRVGSAAQLRVSASMTIAEHLVPGWLVALNATDHAPRVELTAANSAAIIERVAAGEDDLGLIETPAVPQRLKHLRIATDEVVLVVAPGHPWARHRSIDVQTLASTALITREAGSGTRVTLERSLAKEGLSLTRPLAELSTTASIRALVLAGGGAAAMSELSVRDDVESGTLVRVAIDAEPLLRPFTAVWDASKPLAPAAREFLDIARSTG